MKNKGFTLIELLVVIVLMSLLGGIAIGFSSSFFKTSEDRYYNALESNILLAGNDYFEDHRDELPTGINYSEVSLASLIDNRYIEPVTDTNGNLCRNGSVFAYRENNKFKYEVCLADCGGYSSSGRYCSNILSREIMVSAKTKTSKVAYDVTRSYNSASYTKNENVLVTMNMNSDYSITKYILTNTNDNSETVCNTSNDNTCTKEINKSGTYKIESYEGNNEISSKYINIKIARNGSNFTLNTSDGQRKYLISQNDCSKNVKTKQITFNIIKGNSNEEYKSIEYRINNGEYTEINSLSKTLTLESGHYDIDFVVTNYSDNVSVETLSIDVSYLINIEYDDNTTATHEVVKGKNYNYLSSLPETKSGKTIKWSKGNTIINPTSSIVDEDCTYTLTGSIIVPYTVTYDSNLGQMDVWGTSYKDRWTRTYDSATGLYNISCAGASGWELLYIPINTTANHLYRVTFDYQIPTAYTALSGYSGIGFQTVNSLVNSNMPSAIVTAYLPTAVTAKTSQTLIFNATSAVTYFVFNFGMAADGVTTTIKIGNVKVYDDTSGTSVFAASPASESKISGTQYGTLASVERTGYTFNGWYTSPSGGTKIETTTTNNATSNQTLYAHWTMGTYTQTYRANGGVGNNSTETIGYWDVWISKPASTYEKTGYTFNCWQSSVDSTCYVGNGWYHKDANVGTSRYLDATWKANTYSVTLNNQSATSAGTTKVWYAYSTTKTVNNVKCYYYTDSALSTCLADGYKITNPSKTGYTFGGYYTSTGGDGTNYVNSSGSFVNSIYKKIPSEIDSSYTNNINLYAKWIANALTFNNQSISKSFSTSAQTFNVTEASNGTGTYTYAISSQPSGNYFTISGTKVTIKANTPAGSHEVVIKATDSNSKVTKEATYTVAIAKVNATCPTISDWTGPYDGSQHSIEVSGGSGGSIQYRWNSTTEAWRDTKPTASVAGTWKVYVQVKGDGNHNTVDCGYKTLTINKVKAVITCANKTYNGSAQTIATCAGGTISGASQTNYKSGGYSITCAGDSNHTAADAKTCSINQKALTITAKAQTINYGSSIATGTGQVTTDGLVSGDSLTAITLKASATNVTTSGTITPSAATTSKGIGNYSVTYKTGVLKINKVNATCPTTTAYTGNYDGKAHSISISGGSGGTVQYSTDNSSWSTTNPTRTSAGNQTTYVRVSGDSNHNTISCTERKITINKAPGYINISTTSGSIVYGTASATCFTVSSSHGGTISITDDNSTANCSISGNTVTCSNLGSINAGTTIKVTAKSAATTNYTEASKVYTLVVNKANPTFLKTETSKSIYNGNSDTYGLVPSIAGKITSSSNATGVATVSQASNCSSIGANAQCVITVTGKSVGSATITHTFTPNSSNYNSVTTTMPVTIKNSAFTVTFAGVNPIGTSLDSSTVTLAGSAAIPVTASSTLALAANTNYVVSFDYKCASGSNQFDVDFFPDSLPQTNPTATTTLQHMDWITSSSNSAMGSAQLRFFDDFQGSGETDITITNIMLSRTSTKTVYYGSTYGDLPAPTRSGYTFNGWYTASNGGTQITSSSKVSTAANHTLYARWSKTTCCPSGGWYNGGYCYNTATSMTQTECTKHSYYWISGNCYTKRYGANC